MGILVALAVIAFSLSREITMNANEPAPHGGHAPWNKGKVVGQKAPLKLKDVWAIRIHLQMQQRARELALFNLALDSKLRGHDLVSLGVRDVCQGDIVEQIEI